MKHKGCRRQVLRAAQGEEREGEAAGAPEVQHAVAAADAPTYEGPKVRLALQDCPHRGIWQTLIACQPLAFCSNGD